MNSVIRNIVLGKRKKTYAFDHIPKSKLGALYGLRRLRSDYKGYAIRVRRSSDSAELDIGFVGENLDTVTLLAFVGAGSGYITTFYGQTGSNNVTQTTVANQPRIVNAGVVDVSGVRPAIYHDGVNDALQNLSVSLSSIMSLSLVAQCLVAGVDRRMIYLTTTAETTNGFIISQNAINKINIGQRYPTVQVGETPINISNQGQVISSYIRTSTTSQKQWYNGNGTLEVTGLTESTILTRIYVGASTIQANQYISEFAVMEPLTDTERKKLEQNQGKYYNITVV